jgi:SAM-dependent methyltransferase
MIKRSEINDFYREKLKDFGASARGMGWRDEASQHVRFAQVLKIIKDEPFTLNDLGCGNAEIVSLLESRFGNRYFYTGYDALNEMITLARRQFKHNRQVEFVEIADYKQLTPADYSIASGIFNVRNNIRDEEWQAYILQTLRAMSENSRKGFSFNALTSYSDPNLMRPELFYSDPLVLFDFCKIHFSRNVALLHDYDLYDFTILVKKEV